MNEVNLTKNDQSIIQENIKKKRKIVILKNGLYRFITYFFSSITILITAAVLIFIFQKGWNTLSFDLLTSNNEKTVMSFKCDKENDNSKNYIYTPLENEFFSSRWGIAFTDSKDTSNEDVVLVSYIDSSSPLLTNLKDENDNSMIIKKGDQISEVILNIDNEIIPVSLGNKANSKPNDMTLAKWYQETFDKAYKIKRGQIVSGGNGIRGSLLTTLLMISLTLLFALPLGIIAAIYLSIYAKNGRISGIIKSAIDLLSGIPSIIYGLLGAIIFIPLCSNGSNIGSILSGSLTLALMVLPLIMKNTIESIKTIDSSLIDGSLALASSNTQTLFKIILPNSISGILTGTILSISRIIGESASLIYAVGTAIKDKISIFEPSSTLAVHIWNLMHGENPNYEIACSISIVIIFIIIILNILLSLISMKFNKNIKANSNNLFSKIKMKFAANKIKKENKANV